jgi:putative DNA primase/helicase
VTARTWDDDPDLRAIADAEREQNRAAQLEVADARPPDFSDEALALRFSAKHGGDTRYCADWGRWLLWKNTRWEFDTTLRAFDMARAICRVASAEVDPKQMKLAAMIASAKTRAAVVSLAREDRRHAATPEQWDIDPALFSTPDEDG